MSTQPSPTRRDFLAISVAAGAASLIPAFRSLRTSS
jgi:hypothetical protein